MKMVQETVVNKVSLVINDEKLHKLISVLALRSARYCYFKQTLNDKHPIVKTEFGLVENAREELKTRVYEVADIEDLPVIIKNIDKQVKQLAIYKLSNLTKDNDLLSRMKDFILKFNVFSLVNQTVN